MPKRGPCGFRDWTGSALAPRSVNDHHFHTPRLLSPWRLDPWVAIAMEAAAASAGRVQSGFRWKNAGKLNFRCPSIHAPSMGVLETSPGGEGSPPPECVRGFVRPHDSYQCREALLEKGAFSQDRRAENGNSRGRDSSGAGIRRIAWHRGAGDSYQSRTFIRQTWKGLIAMAARPRHGALWSQYNTLYYLSALRVRRDRGARPSLRRRR